MLSDLSVKRPVFAAVAAIMLCVIGLAAFLSIPIRELPSVDPPVVSISPPLRPSSCTNCPTALTAIYTWPGAPVGRAVQARS